MHFRHRVFVMTDARDRLQLQALRACMLLGIYRLIYLHLVDPETRYVAWMEPNGEGE